MLLNAHRIVQESKNEELIVLTIADITEVKRLAIELQVKENKVLEVQMEVDKKATKVIEDSNKRYNMLLMQSPFAFAIMQGKDLVVTLANDSLKEMWGKGKQIEGKPLLEILPEIKDSPFPRLINEVYKTGIPHQEYETPVLLLRNGKMENVYFNFVYQPYYESDATISGVVVIADEVTSHFNTKNELIEAKNNAELKTQIAEDAVKAKQQFLSNMSHEIRTPMNAIIGFTNVVLKSKLDETQKEYLNAIKVSGDALVILINDILDLAKVDSGKMTFEQTPFNLSASIDIMIQLFETKIQEKNLELYKEFDETIDETLIGDPMRLRQIILNLVSNAVKFTAQGKITMCVKKLSEDADKISIEFTITDTGIGIPKNKLGNIFNNFEQASKETSSSYGGTGLGLAIVKQLVELQGGTIIVKSELGKGSTFGFVLSFDKNHSNSILEEINEQDAVHSIPSEAIELKNIRVLVAEDMALNQLLIKIILADFDFEVDIAENGKIAVEKLASATLGWN
jgi:two-component system CheB/CheR fusion protein